MIKLGLDKASGCRRAHTQRWKNPFCFSVFRLLLLNTRSTYSDSEFCGENHLSKETRTGSCMFFKNLKEFYIGYALVRGFRLTLQEL